MLSLAVLSFASLTANACRIVGIGFSALSKPGQAHHQHAFPCAGGGPGGSRTRVQNLSTSTCGLAPSRSFTAGRRKPLVYWRAWIESNDQPSVLETGALPVELQTRKLKSRLSWRLWDSVEVASPSSGGAALFLLAPGSEPLYSCGELCTIKLPITRFQALFLQICLACGIICRNGCFDSQPWIKVFIEASPRICSGPAQGQLLTA